MELVHDSVLSFECHHLRLLLYVIFTSFGVRRKGMFVSPRRHCIRIYLHMPNALVKKHDLPIINLLICGSFSNFQFIVIVVFVVCCL